MAQIDTLRPISTRKVGAGTAVPSGTLHEVTSDDNDATYIQFDGADAGDNWSLRLEPHTPPANHQRHRIRGRIRIRTDAGNAIEDIDLGRGESDWIDFGTVGPGFLFSDESMPWSQDPGYGLSTSGSLDNLNIGGGWFRNPIDGATEFHTSECYVDIDNRARPNYSPEVRDASGTDQSGSTVADTRQPILHFGGVGYDDLPALNWSVQVGDFSAGGSGSPPSSVMVDEPMADGPYVATFTVRSTIRGSDPFEHTQMIPFNVLATIPPPSPPVLRVERQFGGYRLDWSNPGGQPWDNDYVVAEVWRDDCEGSHRIAVVPDGLNGTYLDLAIPQLDPQHFQVSGVCEIHTGECDITYRVRYHGFVSTFVELPDTIPQDLILAWTGSDASIPSGWSRVTALNGRYVRGSNASVSGATGGSSNHSHTTSGHTHPIGSHSHSLGGSTGSSNSSTTSARFNGASETQADQPHSHSRPSSTGTQSQRNSGSRSPGTNSSNNNPPSRSIIWIQSDGAQAQYPVGVLGFATESVGGWTDDSDSSGRFLWGNTGVGEGGTFGSTGHTHVVNSHTHSGFSHTHSLGNTGLSVPVGTNAGFGVSKPAWLARHRHPMHVDSASTGSLNSTSGGTTDGANLEPPNRRLRILRNTGGGTQTRIIGIYRGDIANLDPLLTRCDGTNGTPDMRGLFARDQGGDSVGSTGGSTTHNHSTNNHDHDMGSHNHDTDVEDSNNSSFDAPSFGDLGPSPTTGHNHGSGSTSSTSPNPFSRNSGSTNTVNHIPEYEEVHFVRLDGTIGGGPLPVPELKVTEFSSQTVPAFTYNDGQDRLATFTEKMAVTTDRNHDFPRTVVDSVPLNGGLHTVSTQLAGEDVSLVIAVEGKPAIDRLERVLSAERVYYSPVGGHSGWFAPAGWRVFAPTPDVKVLVVSMVRQPWPSTPNPEDFL